MRKGKKTNTYKKELSGKIIRSGRGERTSRPFKRIISGWLTDEDGKEEKDAALQELFEGQFQYREETGEVVKTRLNEMRRRLGMEEYIPKPAKTVKLGRRKTAFRVAAILLPFLVVSAVALRVLLQDDRPNQPGLIAVNEIVVTAGSDMRMTELIDGSGIWLKEGTTITHAESFDDERRVGLNGEAYFSVARDEQKPFIVQAGGLTVRVLGTEFNVSAYKDENFTKVTVSSGRVEVGIDELNETRILEANDELIYDRAAQTVSVYNTDVEDWRASIFNLRDITLKEVLGKIETYYGVKVYSDSTMLDNDVFKLNLHGNESLKEMMDIVSGLKGFRYEIVGNEVIINP